MGSCSDKIYKDDKIKPEFKVLKDDIKCPIIGLGTALIKEEEHIDVIYQSIKDGTRLIDTQKENEIIVGKGIKKALTEGIVERKDLFIVTKLELEEKEDPEKAIKGSLERLQLDYVDLYLDRWPSCINLKNKNAKLIPINETWKKMENLVNLNLTRTIGVSNYNVENLFNILSCCKIKPVVDEVEFHPYMFQKDLKDFCDKENIVLFAYNPLVKGAYCDKNVIYDRGYNLFKEATVEFMKKKEECKNITKAQLILNWHMCIGVVPIPGTLKPERMKENLASKNFTLNKNKIDLLSSFTFKQHRFNDGSNIFGMNIFA